MVYTKQEGLKDCGVCCLQNILRYYGGYKTTSELRKMTNTNDKGTSIYNIVKASKSLGFESKAYRCGINDLYNESFPMIAYIKLDKYDHFVILDKIDIDKISIFDPIRGKIKYSLSEFLNVWQNIVITFNPKSIKFNKPNKNKIKKFIKYIFDKYKIPIIIISSLSVLIVFMELKINFFSKTIYDGKIKNNFFIVLFILLILKSLLNFVRINLSVILDNKIDNGIFLKTYKKLFSLPLSFHHKRPTGDITSKINDLYSINTFLESILNYIFVDILFIIFILLSILFIRFSIFILFLIYIIIFFAFFKYFNDKNRKVIYDYKESLSKFNSSLVDNFLGINTIKNLLLENKIIDNQNNLKIDLSDKKFIYYKHNSLLTLINEILKTYFLVIIIMLSYNLVLKKIISLGTLSFIFIRFHTLSESLNNILNTLINYDEAKISFERINELLDEEEDNDYKIKLLKNINSINFNNISFSYDDTKILNKFNLVINKGDYIYLNGESGIGKSTIFKLLNKEYKITSGNIYIDNYNLNDIKTDAIRNKITYVSQNEYIFNDTIKNNIIMNKNIKNNDLKKVLKVTTLDKILKKRDLNLDYVLEENGNNISGGERQKIIIARTLLRGTDYIIFDETMNEIDTHTINTIIKNIKTIYNKTIVVISHKELDDNLFSRRVTI